MRAWDNFATALKNKLPPMDRNARRQHRGEHHAILKLPNGLPGFANYAGPGTNIVERTKQNDPPRTAVDKIAQAHDLRYSLHPEQQRDADAKMLQSLEALKSTGGDSAFNIALAESAIRAKMIAEDTLCIDGVCGDFEISTDERVLLQKKLSELEQEGFGDSMDVDTPEPTNETKPVPTEQAETQNEHKNIVPGSRLRERLEKQKQTISQPSIVEPTKVIKEQVKPSSTVPITQPSQPPTAKPLSTVPVTLPQTTKSKRKPQKGKGVTTAKSVRFYTGKLQQVAKAFELTPGAMRLTTTAAKQVLSSNKTYTHKQTVDRISRKVASVVKKHINTTDKYHDIRKVVKSLLL